VIFTAGIPHSIPARVLADVVVEDGVDLHAGRLQREMHCRTAVVPRIEIDRQEIALDKVIAARQQTGRRLRIGHLHAEVNGVIVVHDADAGSTSFPASIVGIRAA